jgi:RNA polymerase sigma factor (TIGR02999 family)
MDPITKVLEAIEAGKPQAAEQLLPLVYDHLRNLAAAKLSREAPGQTLQATALVHEAWLRVAQDHNRAWQGHSHFLAAAAEAMRRILIDRARRRRAARHGGGQQRLDVDEIDVAAPAKDDDLLAVHEALDGLAAHDPRKAELIKLRYFVGLSLGEAAQVLGVSEPTAKRDWAYARAWMYRAIQSTDKP